MVRAGSPESMPELLDTSGSESEDDMAREDAAAAAAAAAAADASWARGAASLRGRQRQASSSL